jgi:L-gulono-1,4-lactone dehydrogenase
VSTSDKDPNPFHGPEWMDLVSALDDARTAFRSLTSLDGPPFKIDIGIDDKLLSLGGRKWSNWAGNQHAAPADWEKPKSEHDVVDAILEAGRARKKVRVLGKGYSFSPLVPTEDEIIDATRMDDCSVDPGNKTVTAGPGAQIDDLQRALGKKNLCLETAPVIPWVTVGGVLGTGVHGTGKGHGTLADLVVQARVIDASGTPHVVPGPQSGGISDEWRALGCNLGALGVVTEVTFKAVDLFNLEAKDDTQNYWLQDTMLSIAGLRSLLQEAPYVSALWWPTTERCWVKKWKRTDAAPTHGQAQYFLDQLGVWLGAGPVTKIGKALAKHPEWTPIFAAMVFDQIKHQEYAAPAPEVFHYITKYPMVWDMSYAFDLDGYSDKGIGRAVDAWKALVDILEHYRNDGIFPQNMAVHMRHIRSSNSFLSPSTGHDGSLALEVVTLQGQDYRLWSKFFATVECEWLKLCGRPHWGKLHGWGTAGGEPHDSDRLTTILGKYPAANLTAFSQVRQAWDPQRMFENRYTAALKL